tara:strand:+ start:68 stop:1279 length:1212 start_codon:yes stop_codon:yes gene_type:complete
MVNVMKKHLLICFILIIGCGNSAEETTTVQDTTTTTVQDTTTTTVQDTTTTTTTTIPFSRNEIYIVEMNTESVIFKNKTLREAYSCLFDRDHINKNILQNTLTTYDTLIPPDFVTDDDFNIFSTFNDCDVKNFSERFKLSTDILKGEFDSTNWFDDERCTHDNKCVVENLKYKNSSSTLTAQDTDKVIGKRATVNGCGPGDDGILHSLVIFSADFLERIGVYPTLGLTNCKELTINEVKTEEFKNNNSRLCDGKAEEWQIKDGLDARVSKIYVNNLYEYLLALTQNLNGICYGLHFSNFSNNLINENLEILKNDVNNIEAARIIENELLSNYIFIPLGIPSDEFLLRQFNRTNEELENLYEQLNNAEKGSDAEYDLLQRIEEIELKNDDNRSVLRFLIPAYFW